jgi:glycosyltransferase involved in cell wall biosynthesis
MGRVIFCNRYYRPDHSATAQLLTDLAEYLAERSVEVIVVTSRQRYDDASARLPAREQLDGVTIYRVWTSRLGRDHLAGRALDYVTFYLSASLTLLRLVTRHDLLIMKTDPPLLSVLGWMVARIKGARLIHWLQDLFPEVARELGINLPKALYRLVTAVRDASLKGADANVVLGRRMAQRLRATGIGDSHIIEIPNWVIDRDIKPVPRDHNPLRAEWGLKNRFVVGYSGNLGRAHDIDTMYAAARHLSDDPRFLFLFIGGGAGMKQLQARVAAEGPANILFRPYQPIEQLSNSLSAPDLHWATLSPMLEGLIVPSKSYGVFATGRPLLFIGASDGEIGSLITTHQCGAVIEPGRSEEVVKYLKRLSDDPEYLLAISRSAQLLFERKYAYGISLAAWEKLISDVWSQELCRPA